MKKYILVLFSLFILTNCDPVRIEGTVVKKETIKAHWYEETPVYVVEAGFAFYPHVSRSISRPHTSFHSSSGRSTPRVKTSSSYRHGRIYGVYPLVMWHNSEKKYWVSEQYNLFIAPTNEYGEQIVSVDSVTFSSTNLKDKVCFDDDKKCEGY